MQNAQEQELKKHAVAGNHGQIYAILAKSILIGAVRHPVAVAPRDYDKQKIKTSDFLLAPCGSGC